MKTRASIEQHTPRGLVFSYYTHCILFIWLVTIQSNYTTIFRSSTNLRHSNKPQTSSNLDIQHKPQKTSQPKTFQPITDWHSTGNHNHNLVNPWGECVHAAVSWHLNSLLPGDPISWIAPYILVSIGKGTHGLLPHWHQQYLNQYWLDIIPGTHQNGRLNSEQGSQSHFGWKKKK